MDDLDNRPYVARVMLPARADVQTQLYRVERLNGLRGMVWAYAVCHFFHKSPTAISIDFAAPNASLGRPDGPKQSNKLMHYYILGKGAPVRGPRGKFGFDLVGAISADPRGALAEHWLDHRLLKMLALDTTLPVLRDLLYEVSGLWRALLFDLDPARDHEHVAWRRRPFDNSVLPEIIGSTVLQACLLNWHPREKCAKEAFGIFEMLIGLWCEARLMYDSVRMHELLKLILIAQDLAWADEIFPYILQPFLAFLSFDGPDQPPARTKTGSSRRKNPAA
jgi:hypothetical protein